LLWSELILILTNKRGAALKLRCLLRLGVDLVMQINWEVLAGMNAEWVGEWLTGKAVKVAGRWRMWGMGSDEDEDD